MLDDQRFFPIGTACSLRTGSHRVHKEYIALIDGRLGGEDGPFSGATWTMSTMDESCLVEKRANAGT